MILQSRRVVKKYLDKNVMSDNVRVYAESPLAIRVERSGTAYTLLCVVAFEFV